MACGYSTWKLGETCEHMVSMSIDNFKGHYAEGKKYGLGTFEIHIQKKEGTWDTATVTGSLRVILTSRWLENVATRSEWLRNDGWERSGEFPPICLVRGYLVWYLPYLLKMNLIKASVPRCEHPDPSWEFSSNNGDALYVTKCQGSTIKDTINRWDVFN